MCARVFDESNARGLDEPIARGLDFLRRSQLPTGEFRCYMSTDHALERDAVVDSSPFPTALVAYSLGFAEEAKDMLERCARFFLREMEGRGLWRYWTKRHQYHSVIPPDLDDIACVSYVLRRQGVEFPDNVPLVLANRDGRGLFQTWVTPRWRMPASRAFLRAALPQLLSPAKLYYFWKLNESGPADVDCVVNANVLFYLGAGRWSRPVVDYLLDSLRRGAEDCCDKWHLNRFTFYYAVSRNFHAGLDELGAAREESVARIAASARADGSIGENALDTALAACALLYWKSDAPELERAIHFLLSAQRVDGAWPRAVLYYGGPKKFYGWGSEELTTGFCLEALLHFRRERPGAD